VTAYKNNKKNDDGDVVFMLDQSVLTQMILTWSKTMVISTALCQRMLSQGGVYLPTTYSATEVFLAPRQSFDILALYK